MNREEPAWEWLAELERRGQPYALVTVVKVRRPSSARPGMRAVVTEDGALYGWVGGVCAQSQVVDAALATLARQEPVLLRLDPDPQDGEEPGVVRRPLTCASHGAMDLLIEPRVGPPRLVVVGTTPVAEAVARVAEAAGAAVHRVSWEERESEADFRRRLASLVAAGSGLVVATQGAYDEVAVSVGLQSPAGYLGLVASARRAEAIRDALRAAGVEGLDRLHAPAGLPIGARTAQDVAVSILAEWVEARRPHAEPAAAPLDTAVDPVCGMSVDLARTPYRAEYAGRTYGFCGPGCRERFLGDPARYVAVGP
ncbi:MAG: XdhC family protein [Firmicutes bacterium]|nr:XdhC family protein [Alicyclobacillaceae bacterium]MCL6496446.1 XdhC family protein [Bacillota bacterium]